MASRLGVPSTILSMWLARTARPNWNELDEITYALTGAVSALSAQFWWADKNPRGVGYFDAIRCYDWGLG
jgi:hypothetical protein